MSGIIPKEELASFQRWQAHSFDSPKAPPTKPEPAQESVAETSSTPLVEMNLPTAEDIERIYEEARTLGYQTGFEEGRQAAEQAGRDAANDEAERFLKLANSLHGALDELDQTVAEQLLALATEIAAQVVSGSITVNNEMLLPIIREAIAALPIHHTHLMLRLNPADAAAVRAQLGEHLNQTGAQIIEDNEISPGGCLIRAGSSEVDATIETRWRRVLEAIGAAPREWLQP